MLGFIILSCRTYGCNIAIRSLTRLLLQGLIKYVVSKNSFKLYEDSNKYNLRVLFFIDTVCIYTMCLFIGILSKKEIKFIHLLLLFNNTYTEKRVSGLYTGKDQMRR